MEFQGPAVPQRYCVRCGTALNAGRCPLHGTDISLSRQPAAPTSSDAVPSVAIPPPVHYARDQPHYPPSDPVPTVNRAWQPAPGPTSPPKRRWRWLAPAAAMVVLGGLVADNLYLQHIVSRNRDELAMVNQRLTAQNAAANGLSGRLGGLESKFSAVPDPAAVAKQVQASVFTIETNDGLGSGWVVSSANGTSTLVTDYHVIATVWTSSSHTVQVRQDAKHLTGTVTKVDVGSDLAIVTVGAALPVLVRASTAPVVGDAVLIVGSPLGLGGTVSNGIVSSFRDGRIQFSAPISPGDSGGPLVNRYGQVIGVAQSKLVGNGAEGLSFAIPVATVCVTVAAC